MDAIDFSGNNYPYFEGLRTLPLDEVILVVDDSHGFGVVGEKGGGVYKMVQPLKPKELIVCASLGKSMGIQAGAIFASEKRIAELTHTELFGGASPCPPAYLATLMQSEPIYAKKRILLQENLKQFLYQTKNLSGFLYMENHPAFSFSDTKIISHLNQNNIITTSFGYPKESNSLMNRIVLSAAHTPKDVSFLSKTLNAFEFTKK